MHSDNLSRVGLAHVRLVTEAALTILPERPRAMAHGRASGHAGRQSQSARTRRMSGLRRAYRSFMIRRCRSSPMARHRLGSARARVAARVDAARRRRRERGSEWRARSPAPPPACVPSKSLGERHPEHISPADPRRGRGPCADAATCTPLQMFSRFRHDQADM